METAAQGPVVTLSTDWIDNLHRVFVQAQDKEHNQASSSICTEKYLVKILEDPFFEPRLDMVVRESVDNETETLD